MIFKKNLEKLFSLCCVIIFFGGCASGPQYVPDELENRQMSESMLVKLHIDARNIDGLTRAFYIDGEKVRAGANMEDDVVFLMPGTHSIKYEIKKETQLWKDWVRTCESLGSVSYITGKTCMYRIGFQQYKYKNSYLGGVPRYHQWTTKSIERSLSGGEEYWLSKL